MTQQRQYRYFEFVLVAFVTVLVCSNLVGPAKIAQVDLPLLGAITFGAGVLFFPVSYVFGDILTEVYGYARAAARRVERVPDPEYRKFTHRELRRRRPGQRRGKSAQ